MATRTLALACLLLLPAGFVAADERRLEPGEKVRVTLSQQQRAKRVVGRVIDDDGVRLVVDAESKPSFADIILDHDVPGRRRLEIPWSNVRSVEVARGRRTNWPASLGFGLAVGGGSTLLAATAAGSQAPCAIVSEAECSRQARELVLVGVGLTVAASVGAALFAKTERWAPAEPRRLRLSVAAAPRHGVRVAVSLGR